MTVKKSAVINNSEIGTNLSFNLGAKMNGVLAESTNCCLNPMCIKRANSGVEKCICTKCFAKDGIKAYRTFRENITENYYTMADLLPIGELPIIDFIESPFFRFESHGDLYCVNQAKNYINTAAINPLVSFALWTKNPWYLWEAVKETGKPVNMRNVYSYLFIVENDEDLKKAHKRWNYVNKIYPNLFDSIFIVLSPEYAASHPEMVNCGARSCFNCHRCYNGNEEFIYEVLK